MTLLRPHQINEMHADKENLERQMNNPHIQDRGLVANQLRKLNRQLETQTPKPYSGKDLDSAVTRSEKLKAEILDGMPSQEEMRKSPPGAVDKHRTWEKKNKAKLLEWKEIQLRLNAGTDENDVANFERFRPTSSTLSMHNAVIPGKQYFMPSESPQYKESHDRIFSKETKKRGMSKEARQKASERMKAMHAAKKAAKE